MVRVGITGIGGYGRLLLDQLLQYQNKGLLRLCLAVVQFPRLDSEHSRYLARCSPHTRIVNNFSDAVGSNIDLMLLPVPIAAHRELTEASLAANWNVLVEKPLAGSIEDARAIIDAEKVSGKFVAVGYQYMYGQMSSTMKQAILSGKIGELLSIRTCALWGRPSSYYTRNNWSGKFFLDGLPVYDSPINNAMAHFLNLALYLAGNEPDKVASPCSVDGSMFRAHQIETLDTAHLIWKTHQGVDIEVFFSHTGVDNDAPVMIVEGTHGRIFWQANSHWEIQRVGKTIEYFAFPKKSQMIEQVVNKVNYPEASVFTPEQALAQVEAVAIAHEMVSIMDFPAECICRVDTDQANGEQGHFLVVEKLADIKQDFINGKSIDLPLSICGSRLLHNC